MNRTLPPSSAPNKRRKTIQHKLHHTQASEADLKHASQDEAFFRSQLLRSIALAISAAGYDSAKPSAMEQLMALTENFMERFLLHVQTAMLAGRRSTPTVMDFAFALAHTSPSSAELLPHLKLQLPPHVTLPSLSAYPPEVLPLGGLDSILGDDLSGSVEARRRTWIPKHLPALPSRHAWQATPVYPSRETDALKIREKATEGGIQAEKSLRRLAKAEKEGVTRIQERRRKSQKQETSTSLWMKAMGSLKSQDEKASRQEETDSLGFGAIGQDTTDDRANRRVKEMMDSEHGTEDGGRVNWETRYWRSNAAAAAARS